jgi:hypothetical protein
MEAPAPPLIAAWIVLAAASVAGSMYTILHGFVKLNRGEWVDEVGKDPY